MREKAMLQRSVGKLAIRGSVCGSVWFVLMAFILALSGCGGGSGSNAVATGQSYGDMDIKVQFYNPKTKKFLAPTISNVVASVSAADLDAQTKNLTNAGGGVWTGTMQVRVGKSRTVTLEAYDTNNVVVYRNCSAITLDVVEGNNYVTAFLCDVSGNVVINGKQITNLVWNIDNSCSPYGMLAIDSTNVYFVERGSAAGCTSASIKKVPIASGAVATLATGINSVRDMDTDGTDVFWIEDTAVKKVPVGGGAVTTLAAGLSLGTFLALDTTTVYYSDYNAGTVNKVAKTGGAVTVLASGVSFTLRVETDGTDAFFQYGASGQILAKVPVGGGGVTTLYTGASGTNRLLLSGTDLYFIEGNATFKKVPKAGGAATTLASGTFTGGQISADATDIYVTNYGTAAAYSDGALYKIPLAGGAVTTVLSPLNRPDSFTRVDATNVYWVDTGTQTGGWTDGVLRKMAK